MKIALFGRSIVSKFALEPCWPPRQLMTLSRLLRPGELVRDPSLKMDTGSQGEAMSRTPSVGEFERLTEKHYG
jgi:hypothetical protein